MDRGEPDARSEPKDVTFGVHARVCADRVQELVRDAARGVNRRAGEDQAKLVATQTAQNVGLAQSASHDVGDAAQRRVTGGVAIGIVDVLEVIDVEQNERRSAVIATRERVRPDELGIKRAPIEQPRQRIVRGEVPQAVLHPLGLGDVANDRGHGNHHALGVPDR